MCAAVFKIYQESMEKAFYFSLFKTANTFINFVCDIMGPLANSLAGDDKFWKRHSVIMRDSCDFEGTAKWGAVTGASSEQTKTFTASQYSFFGMNAFPILLYPLLPEF